MPVTEYVPQIQRKVILNYGVTRSQDLISQTRQLRERLSNVGATLVELRTAPRRYNTLFPHMQRLYLEFYAATSLLTELTEVAFARLDDHEHEFSVRMVSGPPRL
jgi:hypothetical protein